MSAQRATHADDLVDGEMLDADTTAAILQWMETARVPDGVDPAQWQRWADDGCRARLEADGIPVTPAMLGRWARTGTLR